MTEDIDSGAFKGSIPSVFESQVERNADRIAVEDSDGSVTYAELNAQANRLAHKLLEARGENEEAVGLYLDQGRVLIGALMASLKAGKFYVPLDPTFSADRNKRMVNSAGCKVIVTDERHFEAATALAEPGIRIVSFDRLDKNIATTNPDLVISPERKAYVIFTSGSVGEPKGVIQWQGAVHHNASLFAKQFAIVPGDRHSLLYSPTVYGAARDTFCALLSGATLCHYPLRERGVVDLGDWIEHSKISVYASVATVFRRFLQGLPPDRRFSGVRVIKLGGEGILWRDVDQFRNHFSRSCQLSFGLAMTEAGAVTQMFVDEKTPRVGIWVPLGEPVEDKELLLLDEHGKAIDGIGIGEIAVRSRFLALGYIGRDDLTARVFLPDPDDPNQRIYRTGDIGERFADGRVGFQGRGDFQVKILGHRVDTSEVEIAFIDIGPVKEAAVVAYEPTPGDTQLAAYVSLRDAGSTTEADLREALRRIVPAHMVPGHILVLPELPQTASGKIDRQKLPSPIRDQRDPSATLDPRSAVEAELWELWENALGVEGIGVDDDFFTLGGDSLQATQILLEANERFGVALRAESIFGPARTIAGMAAEIEQNGGRLGKPSADERAASCRPADIDFVEFGTVHDVSSRAEMYHADPSTGLRRPRPNIAFGAVRTNALGFRGPNIEPAKPASTIRIAFLGASRTFDRWVSGNDATWPHLVWDRIQRALPDLRFDYVNAGVPGYNTRHMAQMFEAHVASLEPDVVLIMSSDMNADTSVLARKLGIYGGVHVRPSPLARRWQLWGKVEKNLLIAWRLFSVNSPWGKLQFEPSQLSLGYRGRLEKIVALCRAKTPVIAIVTGGGRLRRNLSRLNQLRASASLVYYMPYMSIAGMIAAREQYQRVQCEVAERMKCGLIDVEDAVPPDHVHFVDSNHFSDAGSRCMAQAVSDNLLANPAFLRLVAERRRHAPQP